MTGNAARVVLQEGQTANDLEIGPDGSVGGRGDNLGQVLPDVPEDVRAHIQAIHDWAQASKGTHILVVIGQTTEKEFRTGGAAAIGPYAAPFMAQAAQDFVTTALEEALMDVVRRITETKE